jgi:hypothetical protein
VASLGLFLSKTSFVGFTLFFGGHQVAKFHQKEKKRIKVTLYIGNELDGTI